MEIDAKGCLTVVAVGLGLLGVLGLAIYGLAKAFGA